MMCISLIQVNIIPSNSKLPVHWQTHIYCPVHICSNIEISFYVKINVN